MAVDTATADQVEQANATGLTPVVFIHGLWLLPSSWDRWAGVFEEAGFTALTPGWPDDPETVEEAHAHPDVFANKTVGQVADHYSEIIGRLSKKPAVIGHSFGGLLAQIVAGRGLSAATVAVDPAPFRGVLPLPFSALKAASPVLSNPANRHRAVPLSYDQFRFAFANAVERGRGEGALRDLRGADARRAALPGRLRKPQPVDGGEGRHEEPRPRARCSSRRARRTTPCPWAISNASYKKQKAQRGRDRDRQDPEPRSLAHDRQRLARGRRPGARLRQAVRPVDAWNRRGPRLVYLCESSTTREGPRCRTQSSPSCTRRRSCVRPAARRSSFARRRTT